jgi:metal-responsive CopG/Arc/MetJ family transcriptional regulator
MQPLGIRIESWAKKQNDKPSRSEAIRRLIGFALSTKAKTKQRRQIEDQGPSRVICQSRSAPKPGLAGGFQMLESMCLYI